MPEPLKKVFGSTRDCPAIEELEQPAHAQHVANCGYCTAQLSLLRSFESPEPSREERAAVSAIVERLQRPLPAQQQPRWWKQLLRPIVLTPALAAMAAALVLVMVNVRPRAITDYTPDTVMRSTRIAAVAPVGDVPASPGELRWQPVLGASRYDILLSEIDGTELWRTQTAATAIEIPPAVRDRIVPLKKLQWQVTAVDSAGNTIASSGKKSFTVTP